MLVAMVTLSGAFLGVVAAIAITALVFFLVGCDNNSNLASDIFGGQRTVLISGKSQLSVAVRVRTLLLTGLPLSLTG